MTIAVFLDTNIFMSDFRMDGKLFTDFFDAYKELFSDDRFKLFITEMNRHEVINNFTKEMNKAFREVTEFNKMIGKLTDFEYDTSKDLKNSLREEYENLIDEKFELYSPSSEAYENVFKRFYDKSMPFRENKTEFKDALIWETIYDYSLYYSDEIVYFISNNHKDFAVEDENNRYVLHGDYDNRSGKIKYFKSLNDFLKEIDYLKIHHFDFQEKEEIMNIINNFISESIEDGWFLDSELYHFFINHHFRSEYIDGWGTDYRFKEVYDVRISDFEDVLEHEDSFYIPVNFVGVVEYAVETANPLYDRDEGDDEFIRSEIQEDEFFFSGYVIYHAISKEVEKIEKVNMGYL